MLHENLSSSSVLTYRPPDTFDKARLFESLKFKRIMGIQKTDKKIKHV
jgi:hypothetical protein